jgi:hypothetical protein
MFATVYIDSLERRVYVKGYGEIFRKFFKEKLENLNFKVEDESGELIITASPQLKSIREVLDLASRIDEDIRSRWCETIGGHSFQTGINVEVDENNKKFIRAICYKCGLTRRIYVSNEELKHQQL